MVQWLRFHAPKAGGLDSIPGQGTRFHIPQLRASVAKKKKKWFSVISCQELLLLGLITSIHGPNPRLWKPHPGLCQHGGDIVSPTPCSQICSHSYLALESYSCCLPWLESISAVMYLISRPNSNLPSSHSITCLI